ncbi:hypothetical protein ACWDTP_05055 [Mycobacterium sp. NPDC003449]
MNTIAALLIAMTVTPLPPCQYEDGNPDGQPCMWTSPRTGQSYYNDGSNYRD